MTVSCSPTSYSCPTWLISFQGRIPCYNECIVEKQYERRISNREMERQTTQAYKAYCSSAAHISGFALGLIPTWSFGFFHWRRSSTLDNLLRTWEKKENRDHFFPPVLRLPFAVWRFERDEGAFHVNNPTTTKKTWVVCDTISSNFS